MRRPGGYLQIINADGSMVERDSFTCCHCQRVVFVAPKAAPADCGGWCFRCGKPQCPSCVADGRCTPFEKRLERAEARGRMLAAITGSA